MERYKADYNKSISSRKKDILSLLASHSNFLGRMALKYPYILDYLTKPSSLEKKSCAEYITEAEEIRNSSSSQSELESNLRNYKYREFSRIIYRDLDELGTFPEIMEELSDLAGAILEATLRYYRRELNCEGDTRFVVLAMGKLGGRELNLSSDIDLIYIYDDSSAPDPNPFFKLSEKLTRTLSAVSEDGFLYRVDLALRPGGGKSTIAVPKKGAVDHYYYWGDTWERAALIKARPVAGDMELGREFIDDVESFVYKKFLDFTLIEDLKDMKTKLDKLYKKRDVKLGRGGIREIEFFVQALQLVNAGEIEEIRGWNTLETLEKLRDYKIIEEDIFQSLTSSYLFLRKVEHSIQLVDERQTHKVPDSPDDIDKLAKRVGLESQSRFEEAFEKTTSEVSKIYRSLFYEPSQKTEEIGEEFWQLADFLTEGNVSEEEEIENLRKLGFKYPEDAITIFSKLLDPKKAGLTQSERLTNRRVIPAFLSSILKCADPDAALLNLERFVAGIGWRTSIYSVLLENPEIVELLSKLFSTTGYLTNFLISHPEDLNIIILKDVRTGYGSKEEMLNGLRNTISKDKDYEAQLDTIRKFKHMETLRICLRDLNNEVDSLYVCKYLTMVAEAVLEVGLDIAFKHVSKATNGRKRSLNMVVLAMGKMGGREMSYSSDLDVMFIYEGEDHEFFSRVGQRLISVLSISTGEGFAYKIDLGLRPSGRSGALVTSYDSFKRYHEESAQIWERQSLIRAVPAAGDMRLGAKLKRLIKRIVYEYPISVNFHEEIKHMRERMEKEIAQETPKKLNIKTGKGGLVDIEFIVQMLQLRYGKKHKEIRVQNTAGALAALKGAGLILENEYKSLKDGLYFFKKMENQLRLLHNLSINDLYGRDFERLAPVLGMDYDGAKLKQKYLSKTAEVRDIYDRIFFSPPGDGAFLKR